MSEPCSGTRHLFYQTVHLLFPKSNWCALFCQRKRLRRPHLSTAVPKAQSRTCKYSFILNIFWYAMLGFIFTLLLPAALSDWHFLESPDDFQYRQWDQAHLLLILVKVLHKVWLDASGSGWSSNAPWCFGESQVQVLWALEPVTMEQHKYTCAIWRYNPGYHLKVTPGVKKQESLCPTPYHQLNNKKKTLFSGSSLWDLANSWYTHLKDQFIFLCFSRRCRNFGW